MSISDKDVYLRMIEYGRGRPDGFSPEEIEDAFSKNISEQTLVCKLLEDAWKNSRNPISHPTPFVLFQDTAAINFRDCKYALSYEANFNYLDYLELEQARKNADDAHKTAIRAIVVSIVLTIISGVFSFWQIVSPITFNEQQYESLLKAIYKNK